MILVPLDVGRFFGWHVDGRIVAIVALTEPDDLWSEAARAEPQTYIGRLYVGGAEHGQGYGAAVIETVASEARDRGDKWLRLPHEWCSVRARPPSTRPSPSRRPDPTTRGSVSIPL